MSAPTTAAGPPQALAPVDGPLLGCETCGMVSRGVPEEFHAIANERMAALNDAYAAIEKERRAA